MLTVRNLRQLYWRAVLNELRNLPNLQILHFVTDVDKELFRPELEGCVQCKSLRVLKIDFFDTISQECLEELLSFVQYVKR